MRVIQVFQSCFTIDPGICFGVSLNSSYKDGRVVPKLHSSVQIFKNIPIRLNYSVDPFSSEEYGRNQRLSFELSMNNWNSNTFFTAKLREKGGIPEEDLTPIEQNARNTELLWNNTPRVDLSANAESAKLSLHLLKFNVIPRKREVIKSDQSVYNKTDFMQSIPSNQSVRSEKQFISTTNDIFLYGCFFGVLAIASILSFFGIRNKNSSLQYKLKLNKNNFFLIVFLSP